MKNAYLPIIASTDNHYLVLLAALIKSIEVNNSSKLPIHLYVIAEKVTSANKKKLEDSIDKQMTSVFWYELDDVILPEYQVPIDWTTFPRNIHARLYIPHFIPEEIEKILYLDVDMIACKDIAALFEIDIDDFIVGAVIDQHVNSFSNEWGGIKNYKALNLPADARYFNTGLMMINCKAWRSFDVTRKVIECIKDNKKFANFPDQYGLNVVLVNRWKAFDPLWNHFSLTYLPNPNMIHFVKRKPIYSSYSGSKEYQDLFLSYLSKTSWKNQTPISELVRYCKKISNVVSKIINALLPR